MDTTLSPKQTDPPPALVARVDEELAHAFEQIRQADEQIARADEQLSKLERDAARSGNRPSLGGRAVRGFTGLTLAACVCVVAFCWQSASSGSVPSFGSRRPMAMRLGRLSRGGHRSSSRFHR